VVKVDFKLVVELKFEVEIELETELMVEVRIELEVEVKMGDVIASYKNRKKRSFQFYFSIKD